jgi:hypothetical protein
MKVLICGSRHFQDRALMERTLSQFVITEVVEGGAPGADTLAKEWASANNIPVTECMAEWEKYGRAAGPIRNRKMLLEGPELVIAFMANGSRGTKNMVKQAEKVGVRTHVVEI